MIRNLIDRLDSRFRTKGVGSRLTAARRARNKKLLLLETLEDRRLLATLFWQGDVSSNWSVAGNWNTAQDGTGADQAPQPANNDVLVFDTNTPGVGNFTNTNDIVGLTDIEIQIVDDDGANDFSMSGNSIELAANGITQTTSAGGATISTPFTLAAPTTVTNTGSGGLGLQSDIANAGNLLTFDGDQTINYGGVLSGTGGVTINNVFVTLDGANTYDGVTTVNSGNNLLINGTLGSTVGGTIVNANGILELTASIGNESIILDGGILSVVAASVAAPGPITLQSDSEIRTDLGDLTLSGQITGPGGFTKTGNDLLTLSGTNNYTGTTNVDAGTLLVNGSTDSASTVNVNNGATLGGNGNVQGAVNVNSGGTLSPGGAPGMLMTGNLDLMDGANFDIEINDPGVTPGVDYDQTQVTGTVTIGNPNFNLSGGRTPVVGDQFIVIDNDLADPVILGTNAPAEGAVVGTLNGVPLRISYVGGDGNDVVLEPALGALIGYKFEDLDADGMEDPGEPRLNGITFELNDGINPTVQTVTGDFDVNNDGVIDPATERGIYRFLDLDPNVFYTSSEVLPAGFGLTTNDISLINFQIGFGDALVAAAGLSGNLNLNENVVPEYAVGNAVEGSIHGYKFEDRDGDGMFDPMVDLPLPGVEFTLTGTDGLGNVINVPPQTTNAIGEFWFTGLPPSVDGQGQGTGYTVTETVPPGFTPTTPTMFTTDLLSRQELVAFANQAMIPPGDPRVEVVVGGTGEDLMFGNTVYGSLHGYKFEDRDGDGIFDPAVDLPLPNVTFTLTGTDGLGNVVNVPPQTTDANGQFWFTDLPPTVAGRGQGTGYTLTEIVPAGFRATGMNPRQFDLFSGQELVWEQGAAMLQQQPMPDQFQLVSTQSAPISGTTFTAQSFVPAVTGKLTEVDIIVSTTAPVGDVTLQVQTVDGAGQPSGIALASVTVPGANVPIGTNQVLVFDLSAAAPNLLAGTTYALVVSSPTTMAPGAFGWDFAVGNLYAPGTAFDSMDSGATWTAELDDDQAFITIMQASTEPRVEVLVGDALMFGNTLAGSIHGHKFEDLNGDGVEDPGEPRLNGWEITLTDLAGNPVMDAFGNTVGSVTTMDMDLNGDLMIDPLTERGLYWFTDLLPGTYVVRETAQAGYVQTTHNPQPITITPGDEYVAQGGQAMLAPNDGRREIVDKCLIFGNTLTASIHGFKFDDLNRNGTFDPATPEPPLQDVTFTITTGTGAPVTDAAGNPVGPQVTGADGRFGFVNLLPGTYIVTETVPTGRQSTTPPLARTITVTRGQELVAFTDQAGLGPGDARTEMLIDNDGVRLQWGNAPQLGSIHGHKFEDLNGDGVEDAGEPRLNGWEITLTDLVGNPVTDAFGMVVAPVMTMDVDLNGNGTTEPNEVGHYWFTNLLPGTYLVRETAQAGFVQTTHNPQPISITGGEEYVGQSGQAMLMPDDPRVEIVDKCLIFGNTLTASIHGFKYNDLDRDGTFDVGEPALAGVTFTLTGAPPVINAAGLAIGSPAMDAAGNLVGPQVTDANGFFGFTNLLSGTYFVTEVVPDGQDPTTTPISREFTITKGQELVARLNQAGLQPGDARMEVLVDGDGVRLEWGNAPELGSIHGHKWEDINGDGIEDPSEPRLNGWMITLTDRAGNPVIDAFGNVVQPSVTMDMDLNGDMMIDPLTERGLYWFTDLLPGTYIVREVVQDGWVQTSHNPQPITITGGQEFVAQLGQEMFEPGDDRDVYVDKWLAFGNLRGEVSWVKHNKHGELLGGVIFVLTRTHSYNHVTDQFTDILDEPIVVQDNLLPDVDPDFGEFRVLGLLPGRYTLAEAVPVPGYDPDNFIETFEITRPPNNVHVATHTWVNTWSKRAFVGSTFALRLDYLAQIGLSEPALSGQPAPVANGAQPAAEGSPVAEPAQTALPEPEPEAVSPAEPQAVSVVTTNPNETEAANAEAEGDGSELIDGSNVPTASQSPWQNANNRFDVNDDGSVTPLDALIGINLLEAGIAGVVPEAESGTPLQYYDVNGDGQLTPLDVLQIINYLDANLASAEGEAASQQAARDLALADFDDLSAIDPAHETNIGLVVPATSTGSAFDNYGAEDPEDEDSDDELESILSVLTAM